MQLNLVDNIFKLIQVLDTKSKIELLALISQSLLTKEQQKEKDFFSCFGAYQSTENAEEMINSIREARYFREKNIAL